MRSMAQRIGNGEPTSMEMCPSFAEVMRSPDMRIEAFSLLLATQTWVNHLAERQADLLLLGDAHLLIMQLTLRGRPSMSRYG